MAAALQSVLATLVVATAAVAADQITRRVVWKMDPGNTVATQVTNNVGRVHIFVFSAVKDRVRNASAASIVLAPAKEHLPRRTRGRFRIPRTAAAVAGDRAPHAAATFAGIRVPRSATTFTFSRLIVVAALSKAGIPHPIATRARLGIPDIVTAGSDGLGVLPVAAIRLTFVTATRTRHSSSLPMED